MSAFGYPREGVGVFRRRRAEREGPRAKDPGALGSAITAR